MSFPISVVSRLDLLQLDAELREVWGIDVGSLEEPIWWEELERECSSELVDRFREVHRAYVSAEVGGGGCGGGCSGGCGGVESRLAEREFFDVVADASLLGRVHSHRRGVIIDTAALVDDLIADRQISGAMLEAGCHAGYLSAWWSRHDVLEVVGSDVSGRALEAGRRTMSELGRRVELVEADLLPERSAGRFELIVAVDVLCEESESGLSGLAKLAGGLVEGGWLVLSTGHPLDVAWGSIAEVGRRLRAMGLGFVGAGCLGGATFGESFVVQNVFVLQRGLDRLLPDDCVERSSRMWPEYVEWAADPGVPIRERSQAWFRARGV
ncbi:MAG: class I SAM-dependent methyltransferase [Planctomycetaceae bacterium]